MRGAFGGAKRGAFFARFVAPFEKFLPQLYAKKKPPIADVYKALAVFPLFIGIAEIFTSWS